MEEIQITFIGQGEVTNKSILFSRFFDRVNQKRKPRYEDNKNNAKNKNEHINNERKDDCAQIGGYPDYRSDGFLSSSIIGNCESQAANCAENGNISSPAIPYRDISGTFNESNHTDYNGYNFVPSLPRTDFPWTNTGELKAGDPDEDEFGNLHACGQYKVESRLFDWWGEDPKISPAIGSSSLTLPDYQDFDLFSDGCGDFFDKFHSSYKWR